MKYNYIKWNKEEKCAIFFPDIDYGLWKKTQLKENAYNNPSLIISSCLITKMDILELFEYYILFFCVDLDAIKCVSVFKIVKIADLLLFLADCNIVNLKHRQKIKE